jgi:hypothetical protein
MNFNTCSAGSGGESGNQGALHNVRLLSLIFGLPVVSHWKVYLPVMGLPLVMIVSAIIAAEKRGKMKAVTTRAVGLILIGQLLLGVAPLRVWSRHNENERKLATRQFPQCVARRYTGVSLGFSGFCEVFN